MKLKVLLVEDNEMILKGLTYTLETEGFEVLTAKNYREAQGKIFGVDGNADFDIAVLDVTLPDGDGCGRCIIEHRRYSFPLPWHATAYRLGSERARNAEALIVRCTLFS